MNQSVQIGTGYQMPAPATFDTPRLEASIDAGQRRQDANALFESCMNASGYRLIPAPQPP